MPLERFQEHREKYEGARKKKDPVIDAANHIREAKANAAKAQTRRSGGQLLDTGIILPKGHEQIHWGGKNKGNGYFVLSRGSATLPWDLCGWKMKRENHEPLYIGFTKLA